MNHSFGLKFPAELSGAGFEGIQVPVVRSHQNKVPDENGRRFDFSLRLESPERLSVTDTDRMHDAVEISHVDGIGPDRRRGLIDETLRRVGPAQLSRGKVHCNEFAIANSDIDDAIRDRG